MRWAHRGGEVVETYSETEQIPQRYVNADRRRARAELKRDLFEAGSYPGLIDTLANRVVPAAGNARRQGDARVEDLLARIQERRASARSHEDAAEETA